MAIATTDPRTDTAHPLDPLSADEIARAWELIRAKQAPGPRTRVISIALHEPPKDVVLRHQPGAPVEREAFAILLDNAHPDDLRGGRLLDPGARALVGGRARRPAVDRLRRVLRVRGRGARRSALAGGHAQARRHRFQPHHDRPVVGRELRLRGRGGAPPGSRADLGSPPSHRQRLRPPGGQPPHRRRPQRDEGRRRPGLRGHTAAVRGRELFPGRRRHADGPQAAGDPSAGGAELRAEGPRADLAAMANAPRLHAARGAGPAHGGVSRSGPRPPHPLSRVGGRHGRPLRRSAPDVLPPQRLRRRRVRHRQPGQLAGTGLRLPRRDPLPRRRGQRQPGRRRHHRQRHLHPRGGLRHPLEAPRLADGRERGPALAPPGGLVHRHRGQLRVRLLLVLLPGRHHPARGQADRHHLQRRRRARRDAAVGRAGHARDLRARSTSTSSACAWT